ncbi:hypothetical protein COV15_01240 [Candidatus Woesearchaeota archaeon CG10_big_fil_rev_8_21_14_0_10_34_12]|nr:MAG: hypothetical protein COV15_01240 [Candidatus Woesearchaeota archaeon CG10_big_fil_rev_8_21_14_0_10_34_12]
MAKKDYSNWSKEELVRELKKVEKRKKYGIVWEDKPETVAKRCETELPILEEDTEKEIKTDDKKPVNILIEGDNYHALSVLNYTHKGAIDVIFIDPPYNTGNNDFVYNDKYVDKEDSYRHSKWLSFMEKRLRLTKQLLKSKGAIFISIDDNEAYQLKLLCDEIFGEKNFIASIIWQKKYTQSNDAKYFSTTHDFILCYAKNATGKFKINLLPRTEKQDARYKNPDNDPRGPWMTQPLHAKSGKDTGYIFRFKNGVTWKPPAGTFPRYSKETLKRADDENTIWFGKNGNAVPRLKKYLNEMKEGVIPKTIWMYDEVGSNDEARKELKDILQANVFDSPKPTRLIKRIIELSGSKNCMVLDFFAGSGTTGNAVLELNKMDAGLRQFILCTNNENNNGSGLKIATDICYPRIKKSIQNLEKESKGKLVSNRPGGLKYYKTGFVDAEQTDTNKHKMVDKSTEMLCLKEDCFDEVMEGRNFRIFKNSQDKHLGIIYDDDGIEPFKKEAKKMKKQFVVYVFSLDESAREEEFEDVADLVELRPIPAVILNVYKRIFR